MGQDAQRLSMLLEAYLTKKKRLKWSTIQQTRPAWNHLIAAVGDLDVAEIGYDEIEDYESYLFSQGLRCRSVKSYLVAVRPVFKWAVRKEYAAANPFEGYKMPRVPEGEIHTYSHAEMCDILAAAPNDRWRALVMTAYSAGLRKAESLNLRIQDIDFDRQAINIQPHKETNDGWEWTPKSYERRTVPLTDELSKLFCTVLTDEIPSGQPYLLLTEEQYDVRRRQLREGKLTDRNRLRPDEGFTKAFRRLRERAGIQAGTFHDLRRTCLTNWSLYLAPQELRKMAGHADIETTMRYYCGVRADVANLIKEHTLAVTGTNRGDKI